MSSRYDFCFVFPPRACLHPHPSVGNALCWAAWGPGAHLPQGGAKAVMSRRDAGLFLHAMCLFPPFYFPAFIKQTLSEPPVAHHFGCCAHPAPALAEQCPLLLPRLAVLPGHWDPPHPRDHTCCHAGSKNKSPLPPVPRKRGPALCWGFSHPSCCRNPADQSGNGGWSLFC